MGGEEVTAQEGKKIYPRLLVAVVHAEDEKKLDAVFSELRIPGGFRCKGKGTATSEMMDIFGLSGTGRLITVHFIPKFKTEQIFQALSKRIPFRRKGSGIVFTVPINGLQGPVRKALSDEMEAAIEKKIKGDEKEMRTNSQFSVIWASVAAGYSDDVIDAARSAGARGGTVMKGRRANSEEIKEYFGIHIQEEQEFVMIVVHNDIKAEVMSAISHACGIKTKAHGVVIALPVDDIMGTE